jgi:hypothetical protein
VMFHYSFGLHFSDNWWYLTSFHIPVGYLYIFFGEMPIQVLCTFEESNYLYMFFAIEL